MMNRDLRDHVDKGPKNVANVFGWDDAILLGGTLISSLLGAGSQKAQLKAQQQQNLAQNALNAKSIALAEKMDQEGLATQVDANGNITYYDATTNTWRTILSPQISQINDASNTELLRSLSIDAPLARGERLRSSQSRLLDQGLADTLRRQAMNTAGGAGAVNPNDVASSLRLSRQGAINAGFDQVQTALNTQQLRTGTGNVNAAATLAKSRSNAIQQGLGNPDLEGLQLSKDMNATDLANAINNYGTVANRAYGEEGITPQNPNIVPNLTAALSASRNAGLSGTGGAAAIVNNIKVPNPVQQPNYAQLAGNLTGVLSQVYKDAQTPAVKRTAGNDWSNYDGWSIGGGP